MGDLTDRSTFFLFDVGFLGGVERGLSYGMRCLLLLAALGLVLGEEVPTEIPWEERRREESAITYTYLPRCRCQISMCV